MTPEREGGSVPERRLRLALVVSHPIQYFAPLYREVAAAGGSELRVSSVRLSGV
ncbi:MAG TPA: hypothetical protein PKX99_10880 [Thermoanaerobaculia bacterium]|nr:hypothetical protein [Thermoanaerobaculia bacterium]